ncbi:MAG TPA: ParB/RepB/Spo0J family partition protein [Steroidobacteraceae bacterium]|nr:ParB/RepB/Spo0J family partition protein [Steroidobacteraceae bacterium]
MAIEQVEPADCTLWQFHQRSGEELSEGSCKDLIASMQRHGQRQPALGRKAGGRVGTEIELIYGGRRLFAATRLGIKLLVDVRTLDDRAAIIEMELENRLRTDITPYERGMSYRHWLNAGVFGSQAELAHELGVSEAQVSKLLRYAELPAAVVGAFDSAKAIREEWAVALAKLCGDPHRRPGLVRRARDLARSGEPHLPEMVFRRLVSDDSFRGRASKEEKGDEVVRSSSGRAIFRIAVRSSTIHFILPRTALSEDLLGQLKCQLTSMLEPAKQTRRRARGLGDGDTRRSRLSVRSVGA